MPRLLHHISARYHINFTRRVFFAIFKRNGINFKLVVVHFGLANLLPQKSADCIRVATMSGYESGSCVILEDGALGLRCPSKQFIMAARALKECHLIV